MTPAARTIFTFGLYELLAGLTFLLVPNMALSLVGFESTEEVWIRLFGLLLLILGYFYIMAVRTETTAFFSWTILPRTLVPIVHLGLIIFGPAKGMLLLFGLIDLAGALWTKRRLDITRPQPQ